MQSDKGFDYELDFIESPFQLSSIKRNSIFDKIHIQIHPNNSIE